MRSFLFCCFCITCTFILSAQDKIQYKDHVYLDNIKSVKFHLANNQLLEPILSLNSNERLQLSFDDMLGGDIIYEYRITHCNRNWEPSDIPVSDYMIGFNSDRIRTYSYSANTRTDYTHYDLYLPNEDVQWMISGNYLLEVIDTEENTVAITRRFMVVEPRVTVSAEVERSNNASQLRSHQMISLVIDNKDFEIQSPQQEVSASVLQNGRWDNAIIGIQPTHVIGDKINFDFTRQLTFPAGNQYRYADLRSFQSRGRGINAIERRTDGYDVIMILDKDRSYQQMFDYEDLNGNYIIGSLPTEVSNPAIGLDYANVHFGLTDPNPDPNGEVYLMGEFTDWECRPEYRMVYDTTHQGYYGTALLKQGVYDYQYVRKKGDQIDFSYYEGNHFRTTNHYDILVYYRPFTGRYDQLVGAAIIESRF